MKVVLKMPPPGCGGVRSLYVIIRFPLTIEPHGEFAAAFTIADIGCWGRMVFMAEGGFEIGHWPHLEAWAGRLKAMPGFALPYDLIPSKDREFEGAPH